MKKNESAFFFAIKKKRELLLKIKLSLLGLLLSVMQVSATVHFQGEQVNVVQQISVSGTVTDENQTPLPGVAVVVKGSTRGAITDANGNFTLPSISSDAVLVFSFVGMKSQEVTVGNQSTINITLETSAYGIVEVVAIGYGTVKKSDMTGSIGSMKAEEILKQPVLRVDQALQGRIAGVHVTNISGAPGTGTTIRIRGGNSINAANEPLYVIDGFIGGGDLNSISPADIASIEVLKDASATAIYGSRGSNGVILITTKRGENRGSGISYNGYAGIQTPVKTIDLMGGREFAEYRNEYAEFLGNAMPFSDLNAVAETDWQGILFRQAPITEHNLTFYNSTNHSNYYVSMNYFNQQGIQLGSGFERYQVRFNFDQALGSYFKVGASVNAAYSIRENPRASAITYHVLPTAPVYNDDGSYFFINQIQGATYDSPVAQDELISDNTHGVKTLGNFYLLLSPVKGLKIKSTLGFNINNSKRNRYESTDLPTRHEAETGGYASISTGYANSIQNENTIKYTNTIGNHQIDMLGGFTHQSYKYNSLNASSQGFSNDVTTFNAIQTGDPELTTASSGEQTWTLLSALFRLNYNYGGKYYVTASGRYDGSSRLAEGNKWQFFPSAAMAWRISEESFMDNVGAVSNLKLRASYGKVGSQAINPYATMARLNSGVNYLGDRQVIVFSPALSANPTLKWEVTQQYNVGIDLGLMNNRINLIVDLYQKKTTDLLLNRELPYQTGFSSRLENVGSLMNQGIELSIDGVVVSSNNFSWSSILTMSRNQNKVLELSEGRDFLENGTGSRIIVGESIGTFFGAKFLGLYQEGDPDLGSRFPGSPRFEDVNGDDLITVDDGQIIGSAIPDFYGGWNNVAKYKNFTLSIFFDFSYGNEIYDLDGVNFNVGHETNVYGHFRNRWTPTNTDTDIMRAGAQIDQFAIAYPGTGGTDMLVHDGSYLRLKTLNLNYDIPLKSKFVKGLAVYCSATNLFTLTSYEGFTPDVNYSGTHSTKRGFDSNGFPPAKTIIFGVRADF